MKLRGNAALSWSGRRRWAGRVVVQGWTLAEAAGAAGVSVCGSAYRATIHALACKALGIRHLRTRPYRPQTNGKAERFIRTLINS